MSQFCKTCILHKNTLGENIVYRCVHVLVLCIIRGYFKQETTIDNFKLAHNVNAVLEDATSARVITNLSSSQSRHATRTV